MTKEQKITSRNNRQQAEKFFNLQQGYVLHHIDPTWKENDIERYIQWNLEDLVVMSRAEHASLHHKGKVTSEETKQKLSASLKGKTNPGVSKALTGRKLSDEVKAKISASKKGNCYKHWKLVDGIRQYY